VIIREHPLLSALPEVPEELKGRKNEGSEQSVGSKYKFEAGEERKDFVGGAKEAEISFIINFLCTLVASSRRRAQLGRVVLAVRLNAGESQQKTPSAS